MTHAVVICAVAEDGDHANALVARLPQFAPILVRLSGDTPKVRAGETLVVVGIWSPSAAQSNAGDLLAATLSTNPRRAILYRLENAPPFPHALDPHVVLLGPAGPEGGAAALAAAIGLAQKRSLAHADDDIALRGRISGWRIATVAAIAVFGLGGAGVAAFLSEPDGPPPAPPTEAAVQAAPAIALARAAPAAPPPKEPARTPASVDAASSAMPVSPFLTAPPPARPAAPVSTAPTPAEPARSLPKEERAASAQERPPPPPPVPAP